MRLRGSGAQIPVARRRRIIGAEPQVGGLAFATSEEAHSVTGRQTPRISRVCALIRMTD